MNKKYTESDRQFVVGRYENGESGSIISLSTGILCDTPEYRASETET